MKVRRRFVIIFSCLGSVVLVLLVLALFVWLLFESAYSQELLAEYPSPDGAHTLSVYLSDGGATTAWTILCDVTGKSVRGRHRIYTKGHCNKADVRWIDDRTVEINGVVLDIYGEIHIDPGTDAD